MKFGREREREREREWGRGREGGREREKYLIFLVSIWNNIYVISNIFFMLSNFAIMIISTLYTLQYRSLLSLFQIEIHFVLIDY